MGSDSDAIEPRMWPGHDGGHFQEATDSMTIE